MFKFDKLVFGDAGWGDEFLIATLMTLLVSILSMGLGLFLAIITVWAKIIQNRITRFIANFYTTVIRGVPELLVIYLIFFGGNAVVMSIAKVFGYKNASFPVAESLAKNSISLPVHEFIRKEQIEYTCNLINGH